MLAIVLIPTIMLLAIGIGGASYLVYQGRTVQRWAGILRSINNVPRDFTADVAEERRLSMLWLAGDKAVSSDDLAKQRRVVDQTFAENNSKAEEFSELNPDAIKSSRAAALKVINAFKQTRQGIDSRRVPGEQVYAFYNLLNDEMPVFLDGVSKHAPDTTTTANEALAANLIEIADSMSKSNALGVYGVGGKKGLSPQSYQEFVNQVGHYHAGLQSMVPRLTKDEQAQFKKLASSEAFKQTSTMEAAIIQRGAGKPAPNAPPLPMSVDKWQHAATQVSDGLLDLYQAEYQAGLNNATDTGNRTFVNSLLAGIGVLLVAIIAAVIAARLSNQLVKRLKRLRAQTLELADKRLPQMVLALRNGEQIDVAREVPPLQYGRDELGQVAEAFNKAQRTAVAAAAQEAEIQSGVRTVFLNIAHRSQLVVRRQLEVLDKAERQQEDPDQLELLFQLDHLATRARRSAENLLILGGERPGRRWRNPVPLVEIVRSAIGETEQYKRVNTGRLPEMLISGAAVADLIHLLAELVDNATAFSPPDSRVEVRGNRVGRGVVVEIEDQGVGLSQEEQKDINDFLQHPPDFGVMALTEEEARLGLFVISQLAARHGIGVTLVDSVYGGVRAIVLIRSALIVDAGDGLGPTDERQAGAGPATDVGAALPTQRQDPVEQPVGTATRTRTRPPFPDDLSWPDDEPASAAPTTHWSAWETTTTAVPADSASVTQELPLSRDHNGGSARPADGNGRGQAGNGHSAGPSAGSTAAHAAGAGRPALPRRRRQANIAPQLAGDEELALSEPAMSEALDPEQLATKARHRMSALQRGTREGRQG